MLLGIGAAYREWGNVGGQQLMFPPLAARGGCPESSKRVAAEKRCLRHRLKGETAPAPRRLARRRRSACSCPRPQLLYSAVLRPGVRRAPSRTCPGFPCTRLLTLSVLLSRACPEEDS